MNSKKCSGDKLKIDGIQALRGCYFLLIFISHSGAFAFLDSNSVWGAFGVSGFFVVSGFLSGYKYIKRETLVRESAESLTRPLKKFYPVYFLSMIVAVFVRGGGVERLA